jgi:hypothetical protein
MCGTVVGAGGLEKRESGNRSLAVVRNCFGKEQSFSAAIGMPSLPSLGIALTFSGKKLQAMEPFLCNGRSICLCNVKCMSLYNVYTVPKVALTRRFEW